MWFLLFIIITAVCFKTGTADCGITKGKTTCITKDLLQMLMQMNTDKGNDENIRPSFYAIVRKNQKLTGMKNIVKFDDVRVNREGGYNPSTGIFTAPRAGLYYVSCTIIGGRGNQDVAYRLMKNGSDYISGYTPVVSNVASSSIQALVEMTKRDRVYIQHRSSDTQVIHGNNHCSFAGYFLNV